MTRDQAIDILWTGMMTVVPLGADLPNTQEDRATAHQMIVAFSGALKALGVTTAELLAAQARYETEMAGI